jgi:dipeptidyl aminopeptidase/acylaminoacyl peptidase
LPAWRIYLGLPQFGRRMPKGGPDEAIRRATEDTITLYFHPIVTQAVDELTGALNDIRSQLIIEPSLPLGIFGFSAGGTAALLAVSRRTPPFKVAATYGAVIDMAVLVDHFAAQYGTPYEWTHERRALADEILIASRSHALAESGTPILLIVGSEDPLPVAEVSKQLANEIREQGGIAEMQIVGNAAHGFVEEPGVEAAPQGPQARAIDQLASDWFNRHLSQL